MLRTAATERHVLPWMFWLELFSSSWFADPVCSSDELGTELEVWEYGVGQELEKSIDELLEIPDRREESKVGINKVSHSEHETWQCSSVCLASNRA